MLPPRLILSFSLMLPGMSAAVTQAYPHKPVRLVNAESGASSDFVARLIAQGLSGLLGGQVTLDNRPGGVVPGETTAKALPDGHTMLLSDEVQLTFAPSRLVLSHVKIGKLSDKERRYTR